MRRNSMFLSLAGCIALTIAVIAVAYWQARLRDARRAAAVPKTEINVVVDEIQGHKIADPYRWLEDQNSPQTRAWINAQNAYTDSLLSRVPGRDALRQEVAAAKAADAKTDVEQLMSQPILRNGRYFLMKWRADRDQYLIYVRKGLNGTDELLVDSLALSPKHISIEELSAVLRYDKFLKAPDPDLVSEYGSAETPGQFDYIYAYSPYHHMKAGTKYPAVLFISGDSDRRVGPLHARKMTALMQASTGSDKPVLLHYDTKAGDSGETPISEEIDWLRNSRWQLP